MGMTALEKFETSERIADYLEVDEYDWETYQEHSSLCYGKIDPIHIDGIADVIRDVREETTSSDCKHERIRNVLTANDRSALINLLQLLRPKVLNGKTSFKARVLSYLIHSRLTELGVAPRWRDVKKPSKQKSQEWNEQQKRFLCDLQVFDMHWIYSTYPKHRVMGVFNGI